MDVREWHPKLFIDADPGGFLIKGQRDFCRAWPKQETVTVKGAHFMQEESPDAVGEAATKFVGKVLAGQIPRIEDRDAPTSAESRTSEFA